PAKRRFRGGELSRHAPPLRPLTAEDEDGAARALSDDRSGDLHDVVCRQTCGPGDLARTDGRETRGVVRTATSGRVPYVHLREWFRTHEQMLITLARLLKAFRRMRRDDEKALVRR